MPTVGSSASDINSSLTCPRAIRIGSHSSRGAARSRRMRRGAFGQRLHAENINQKFRRAIGGRRRWRPAWRASLRQPAGTRRRTAEILHKHTRPALSIASYPLSPTTVNGAASRTSRRHARTAAWLGVVRTARTRAAVSISARLLRASAPHQGRFGDLSLPAFVICALSWSY
jgi:hypothetical protein